jgi:hypothetical protein
MITALFLMITTICTPQEKLEKSVLASGATTASNNEVSLQGTIGQIFTGKASNNVNNINIGFWESVAAKMSTAIVEIDLLLNTQNIYLGQNYPNPADQDTRIDLQLPRQSEIQLILFDVNGRRLGTIYKGLLHKGKYVFSTEAAHLPQGLYRYALLIDSRVVDSKPLLVFHGQ